MDRLTRELAAAGPSFQHRRRKPDSILIVDSEGGSTAPTPRAEELPAGPTGTCWAVPFGFPLFAAGKVAEIRIPVPGGFTQERAR